MESLERDGKAVAAKGGKLFPWFAWCGLVYI
jgi:hypothetical protein